MKIQSSVNSTVDSKVVKGTLALLGIRRERLSAGEKHIGWKMGYGAASARARLGIKVPLVGYLTDAAAVSPGAAVPIADWVKPSVEPEIAVYLDRDLPGTSKTEDVRAAISAVGLAFEFVDLGNPSTDVESVLSRNIAHKKFMLGPSDSSGAGGIFHGLSANVQCNGAEVASSNNPQNSNGDIIENIREMTEVLAACGEHFRAGDVIITGSIVPPLSVQTGQEITFRLTPIGSLSVRF